MEPLSGESRFDATATATPASPRRPSIGISPHAVDPQTVLSSDEIELLHRQFARFNPNANKTRSLAAAHAQKLFRDDFPSLSEWEIQELFTKCDLNSDGLLALHEYVQTRAFHRLVVESENELEIVRSFTILDTDSDGLLVADAVLALVEQAKQPSARLLKRVILRAAETTSDSHAAGEKSQRRSRQQQHPQPHVRAGEITLEAFVATIRDENRRVDQEIAAKTLRILSLEQQIAELQRNLHAATRQSLSTLHRANLMATLQSTRIEVDVLKAEIARMKKELLTDSSQPGQSTGNALTTICETLVATYENEQHVYECMRNLITYCGLEDPVLFRYNLEQSGRKVHVLDSVLMMPPAHIKKSPQYAEMMELAVHQLPSSHEHHQQHHGSRNDPQAASASAETDDEDARFSHLKLNSSLRRQFVFYTMLGDVTNLESMTRSNFIKFVKDCELHTVAPSHHTPLTDPEIAAVYARATTSGMSFAAHSPSPRASPRDPRQRQQESTKPCSPRRATTGTAGMRFAQWLFGCELLLRRQISQDPLDADALEDLIKTHVLPKAKCIPTQNIAPDISQAHVLKLLREYLWRLRQIFVHFSAQSLAEIDTAFTVDMKTFLRFARAFKIIRESAERDGEPYTPPPLAESNVLQPISLMELIREFYAAKLDISFSNPRRRDALDLTFREFVRCLQRIALAMHAHRPPGNARALLPPNGMFTTSFEAVKEDDERQPHHVNEREKAHTPLYNRRGNLLGAATSPSKNCKMTSTSVISTLLQTSRAMAAGTRDDDAAPPVRSPAPPLRSPYQRARSPTKIWYGSSATASAIPFIPLSVQLTPRVALASPRTFLPQPPTLDAVVAAGNIAASHGSPRSPQTPRTPRRQRPITCGGPPVIRIVRSPPSDS